MKLKYLGTAAYEGIPGLFCDCPVCERARAKGGKNLQTRSQAIIDGRLLLDFPMDTYMHVLYGGLDLREVRSCLITHSHADHLHASEFETRGGVYAHMSIEHAKFSLKVFSAPQNIQLIKNSIEWDPSDGNILELNSVEPFEPFETDGYTVTALPADHGADTFPYIYLISKAGKTILYAHDTGYFLDRTWDYLAKKKPFLTFASLDCTTMINECRRGHMGIDACADVRNRLKEIGCADNATKFYLNHFSHNGGLIYDEIAAVAEERNFGAAYDGLEVNI
jgi:phosphoribosyl 1,2-cyclic phosphate phosphodiesterase